MMNAHIKKKTRYLRPDHSLKHGVYFVRAEAVRVEAIEKVLNPQDAESPQILQRTDASGTQLQTKAAAVRAIQDTRMIFVHTLLLSNKTKSSVFDSVKVS